MSAGRWHFMHIIYNVLLIVALPLLALYVLYRRAIGRPLAGWSERMGYLPKPLGRPAVWVHAVSAGEAVAAEAVIRTLHQHLPQVHTLLTAGTPEGHSTATKRLSGLVDHVAYVQYDLPWAVRRALNRVQPDLLVLVESELWPNLIQQAADRGIPVMLANGYVSERTLRRGRSVPFLFLHRWIFSNVRSLCLQSESVKERALALGAPADRVRVVGSVKYDQAGGMLSPEQIDRWRALLRIDAAEPVLVAGSTHPGEEAMVLKAYEKLRAAGGTARLIIAPRHPTRADEVEGLIRAAGLSVVRRSKLGSLDSPAPMPPDAGERPAILLDTMGELASVFGLATVVFLGGSLVPVGGHDILQPLIAGKPVILGPHTHRQRDIIEEALAEGVVWEVSGVDELAVRAKELLEDCRVMNGHSKRAVAFVSSRRGASERCAHEAARLLGV